MPDRKEIPRPLIEKYSSLLETLSPLYGSVRAIHLPQAKRGSKTVIFIQDAHLNLEAQTGIGKVISELIRGGKADCIGLEGYFGEADLRRYHDFPHPETVRMVADYLLRENRISGAAHAALTRAGPTPPFVGVDDKAHYDAHVSAYRESAPKTKALKTLLKTLRDQLQERKSKTFGAPLAAFDRQIESYRRNELALHDYLLLLSRSASTLGLRSNNTCPEIESFLKAHALESSLDFARVEKERAELLRRLVKNMDPQSFSSLLARSVACRMGQIRQAEYYGTLQELCTAHGLRLDPHGQMGIYIRYVLLSDRIHAGRLFREAQRLERECYAALARTPAEKELVERAKYLHLAGKLADFSLSPEEWREFRQFDSGLPLSPQLASFKSFNEEAHARDGLMAANLIRQMEARKAGTAVLVAGGYHAPGVTEALNKAGIAVISFVPSISKVESGEGAGYLGVFLREKTPLERLFAQPRLTVAQNPFGALDPEDGSFPVLSAAVETRSGRDGAEAFARMSPHPAQVTAVRKGDSAIIRIKGLGRKLCEAVVDFDRVQGKDFIRSVHSSDISPSHDSDSAPRPLPSRHSSTVRQNERFNIQIYANDGTDPYRVQVTAPGRIRWDPEVLLRVQRRPSWIAVAWLGFVIRAARILFRLDPLTPSTKRPSLRAFGQERFRFIPVRRGLLLSHVTGSEDSAERQRLMTFMRILLRPAGWIVRSAGGRTAIDLFPRSSNKAVARDDLLRRGCQVVAVDDALQKGGNGEALIVQGPAPDLKDSKFLALSVSGDAEQDLPPEAGRLGGGLEATSAFLKAIIAARLSGEPPLDALRTALRERNVAPTVISRLDAWEPDQQIVLALDFDYTLNEGPGTPMTPQVARILKEVWRLGFDLSVITANPRATLDQGYLLDSLVSDAAPDSFKPRAVTREELLELARAVFWQYDLGEVLDVRPLGDIERQWSIWVRTTRGEYALTHHFVHRTQSSMQELAADLRRLREAGLSEVVEMVRTRNGMPFVEFDEEMYAVYPYHSGRPLAADKIRGGAIEQLGAWFARYHYVQRMRNEQVSERSHFWLMNAIPTSLQRTANELRQKPEVMRTRAENFFLTHYEEVLQAIREAQQVLTPALYDMLPKARDHGDVWAGNFLYDSPGETLTGVIDWDDMKVDARILDAVDGIVPRLPDEGIDIEELTRYLRSYQSVALTLDSPLTAQEIAAIPQLFKIKAAIMFNWLSRRAVLNRVGNDEKELEFFEKGIHHLRRIRVQDFSRLASGMDMPAAAPPEESKAAAGTGAAHPTISSPQRHPPLLAWALCLLTWLDARLVSRVSVPGKYAGLTEHGLEKAISGLWDELIALRGLRNDLLRLYGRGELTDAQRLFEAFERKRQAIIVSAEAHLGRILGNQQMSFLQRSDNNLGEMNHLQLTRIRRLAQLEEIFLTPDGVLEHPEIRIFRDGSDYAMSDYVTLRPQERRFFAVPGLSFGKHGDEVVPPRFTEPKHIHKEYVERLTVLEGRMIFTYFDSRGRVRDVTVEPGQFIYVSPNLVHTLRNPTDQTVRVMAVKSRFHIFDRKQFHPDVERDNMGMSEEAYARAHPHAVPFELHPFDAIEGSQFRKMDLHFKEEEQHFRMLYGPLPPGAPAAIDRSLLGYGILLQPLGGSMEVEVKGEWHRVDKYQWFGVTGRENLKIRCDGPSPIRVVVLTSMNEEPSAKTGRFQPWPWKALFSSVRGLYLWGLEDLRETIRQHPDWTLGERLGAIRRFLDCYEFSWSHLFGCIVSPKKKVEELQGVAAPEAGAAPLKNEPQRMGLGLAETTSREIRRKAEAAAKETIAELSGPYPREAESTLFLLSGSVAEGWALPGSDLDLDIFVVMDSPHPAYLAELQERLGRRFSAAGLKWGTRRIFTSREQMIGQFQQVYLWFVTTLLYAKDPALFSELEEDVRTRMTRSPVSEEKRWQLLQLLRLRSLHREAAGKQDIKRSIGGLRDIRYIFYVFTVARSQYGLEYQSPTEAVDWLENRGLLSASEADALLDALDFLLAFRYERHKLQVDLGGYASYDQDVVNDDILGLILNANPSLAENIEQLRVKLGHHMEMIAMLSNRFQEFVLDHVMEGMDAEHRSALRAALSGKTGVELSLRLASTPDPLVQLALAWNNAAPEVLARVYRSAPLDLAIAQGLSGNPGTPEEIRSQMIRQGDPLWYIVRIPIATADFTPEAVLLDLIENDPHPLVRQRAAVNLIRRRAATDEQRILAVRYLRKLWKQKVDTPEAVRVVLEKLAVGGLVEDVARARIDELFEAAARHGVDLPRLLDRLRRSPSPIAFFDSTLRDGLQIEPVDPKKHPNQTRAKQNLLDALVAAGLRRIEIGSLPKPGLLPPMGDVEEMAAYAQRKLAAGDYPADVKISYLVFRQDRLDPILKLNPLLFNLVVLAPASYWNAMVNTRRSATDYISHYAGPILEQIRAGSGAKPRLALSAVWGYQTKQTPIELIAEILQLMKRSGAPLEGISFQEPLGRMSSEELRSLPWTEIDPKSGKSTALQWLGAKGITHLNVVEKIPPQRILDLIREAKKYGIEEVVLSDTTGVADPRSVKALIEAIRKERGLLDLADGRKIALAAHFHDGGLAFLNMLVAADSGASVFDATLGNLGGLTFARGTASPGGNLALEDSAFLMEALGIPPSGLDLQGLLEATRRAEKMLQEAYADAGREEFDLLRRTRTLGLHRLEPEKIAELREYARNRLRSFNQTGKGIPAPDSLLDPLFRWAVRRLESSGHPRAAAFVDGFRRIWNIAPGPLLEVYGFLCLAAPLGVGTLIGAGLFGFLASHAMMEMIFDRAPPQAAARNMIRRAPAALFYLIPFLAPFLGIDLDPDRSFIFSTVLHSLKNIYHFFETRRSAKAEAALVAGILKQGGRMPVRDPEIVERILPAMERLDIDGLDGANHGQGAAQRVLQDISRKLAYESEFRQEFLAALKKELAGEGTEDLSEAKAFERFLNFMSQERTLAIAEGMDNFIRQALQTNEIPVFQAVVRPDNADSIREMLRHQAEHNAGPAAQERIYLILVPGGKDPIPLELEKMAAGNPYVAVRQGISAADGDSLQVETLSRNFMEWVRHAGLEHRRIALTLALPKGIWIDPRSIRTLPYGSPYRSARIMLLDALGAVPLPLPLEDYQEILKAAALIARQA